MRILLSTGFATLAGLPIGEESPHWYFGAITGGLSMLIGVLVSRGPHRREKLEAEVTDPAHTELEPTP